MNKLIFAGTILFLLVGVGTTYAMGNKQDKQHTIDQLKYEDVKKRLEQNGGQAVITTLIELQQKYSHDYSVMKNLGLAYAQSGDYDQAITWFSEAIKQRPALIKSGIFIAQYGDVLYMSKKYEEALLLYRNSLKYNTPDNVEKYIKIQIKKLSELVGENESK